MTLICVIFVLLSSAWPARTARMALLRYYLMHEATGEISSLNESRTPHWVIFVPITVVQGPRVRAAPPGQLSAELQLCALQSLEPKK